MSRISPSVPVVGEVVPFNAGDVERALTYWADDGTVKLIGVPAGIQDSYRGKEQVRQLFRCLVARRFRIQIKVIKVRGNAVMTRTDFFSDLIRQQGFTPLVVTDIYVVHEGAITSLITTIPPRAWLGFQCSLQSQHEEGCNSIQEEQSP